MVCLVNAYGTGDLQYSCVVASYRLQIKSYQVGGVPDVDKGATRVEVLSRHGVQVDVERAHPGRPLQLGVGALRLPPLDRLPSALNGRRRA